METKSLDTVRAEKERVSHTGHGHVETAAATPRIYCTRIPNVTYCIAEPMMEGTAKTKTETLTAEKSS